MKRLAITNQLVGLASSAIVVAANRVLSERRTERRVPPLWDGHAAGRIVEILARKADELGKKKHAR